jgi:hypothetical protein
MKLPRTVKRNRALPQLDARRLIHPARRRLGVRPFPEPGQSNRQDEQEKTEASRQQRDLINVKMLLPELYPVPGDNLKLLFYPSEI